MSNDFKMKKPKDLGKVDINHLGELIWWSTHLGIGPEKLLSIISKVGNSAAAIRQFQDQKILVR